MLAPRLPLPVPAPLRVGRPSTLFPAPWSVLPWLPGQPADLAPPPEDAAAAALVAFLAALHQPAPTAAPVNPFRGVALAARAAVCEQRMASLAEWSNLVTPAVRQAWEAALAAALDGPPTWIHGDLHPLNLLVHGGALSAVIDWGTWPRATQRPTWRRSGCCWTAPPPDLPRCSPTPRPVRRLGRGRAAGP